MPTEDTKLEILRLVLMAIGENFEVSDSEEVVECLESFSDFVLGKENRPKAVLHAIGPFKK